MGFSRWRRGKDGKPRYTPYYRDLRGREASAGTFARMADADAAWQAAEARARAGLRHDPMPIVTCNDAPQGPGRARDFRFRRGVGCATPYRRENGRGAARDAGVAWRG